MKCARLAMSLALCALVASCGDAPREQVLHVHVWMSGEQLEGDGQPGVHSPEPYHNGSAVHSAIDLSLDVPVLASRPGEPFVLRPSPNRPPTFEGSIHLTQASTWMNVDASETVRTNMAAQWPRGTPATAPGAALRASVISIAGGELNAEIDADLIARGSAHDSRTGFGRGFEVVPTSPWPDCTMTSTTARCTLALRLGKVPPEPAPGQQVPLDADPDPPIRWQRDLPDLRVQWDREGHFVARADSAMERQHVNARDTLHVLMWTSAPGDSREPPASVPRTPTIAP